MSRRRPIALIAALIAVSGIGAGVYAQLESGDRGILPLDSSGVLEVSGIKVDVGGPTAEAARFAGWRQAQRIGFKLLWAKANGSTPDKAPSLDDATLDGLVSSISVEKEQIGPDRYIATLGVLFDRSRSASLVGMAGDLRRSEPMLLIPIMLTAGTPTSLETRNAWQRAWAGFRTSTSAIDYVRPSGMGVDPLLINAAQIDRPGRSWWRNLLDFYGASDVLVAQVDVHRLYPGGPAVGHFLARHGPDGEVIGAFEVTDHNGGDLQTIMNVGVQKMDTLFTTALADGRLRRDRSLNPPPAPPPAIEDVSDVPTAPAQTIQLLIASPDGATLTAASAAVRAIPGVDAVNDSSVAIGGTSSIIATYHGDLNALRTALIGRGWAVDIVGGQLRLSRSSVAPSAPPPPRVDPLAPTASPAPATPQTPPRR